MNTTRFFHSLCLFLIVQTVAQASDSTAVKEAYEQALFAQLYQQFTDSVEGTFAYQYDAVEIGDGIASINVPKGYKYLNGETSDMIIVDIWGNPPRDEKDRSLGMLLPLESSPFNDSSFAINITYTEDGYVDDEDAKDIDYDDLLKSMQEDAVAANEFRVEQGYEPIQLVGWASPPFYDAENKKLHWAKELKFGEAPMNTLNYNIRILGRKGYLELNAIGEMFVLNDVKRNLNDILSNVNFTDGNTYGDFDPNLDKVAAYGIGGLIAGKVLAKAGILAKIGIILAKFWKLIAIGVIAFFAGFKRFFKRSSDQETTNHPPN